MKSQSITRRKFLSDTGVATGLAAAGVWAGSAYGADDQAGGNGGDKTVALVCDPDDRVAASSASQWALSQLHAALAARNLKVRRCHRISEARSAEYCIVAAGAQSSRMKELLQQAKVTLPDAPETLALASAGVGDKTALFAVGTDARGLMYALLEIADRVVHSDPPLAAIQAQKPVVEQPANAVRSIARLFVSDVEDLPWFRYKTFWQNYLSMLATERFNRFALTLGLGYDFTRQIRDCYFHFAYPFFLAVPGYDVKAVGLPDEERDANLAMLRDISEMAQSRGIDFQLGLWTHAYKWTESPQANYTIDGLNADNHVNYCRDALGALLSACPAISGVTIRTHGESGVPEGSYEFWQTIFDGVPRSGRKVEIDLHAKGIDQHMIDGALSTGMPVNVSPKYWAEHTGLPYHQAAIRPTEMPTAGEIGKNRGAGKASNSLFALSNGARRFMRYSYGDLLRADRKYSVFFRMWPGSMKLLLWGDPEMAAAWGRYAGFCGSKGMEIQEPLSFKGKQGSGLPGGRNAYQDAALKPTADWEKYAYTYRLWGRLLYQPDTEPEVWRRLLRTRWGSAAPAAEQALSHSSRIIPLITSAHLPSAANANYWPEIYTNMSISDTSVPSPYSDTPSPKRFGTVSPLDPEMFCTIDEHVAEQIKQQRTGRYSPIQVAAWLLQFAQAASDKLATVKQSSGSDKNAELQRLLNDVQIQILIGKFFAHKLFAATQYSFSQQAGSARALEEANAAYKVAADIWKQLSQHADKIYVSDITFGRDKQLRGNWAARKQAIDDDVDRMKKRLDEMAAANAKSTQESKLDITALSKLMDTTVLQAPQTLTISHNPPQQFHPGTEIPIALKVGYNALVMADDLQSAVMHYRHVNQAEKYETADMKADGNRWTATIPADYTKSPYPLLYFFSLTSAKGHCWQFPGLGEMLCNQPYFVLRQS
jgi:hypothetical protein